MAAVCQLTKVQGLGIKEELYKEECLNVKYVFLPPEDNKCFRFNAKVTHG